MLVLFEYKMPETRVSWCNVCDSLWCVHSALNTTLGLGSNRIAIILQDPVTGSTVNTYRLTLHRHKADYDEPNFNSDAAYAVCGLRQVRPPNEGPHYWALAPLCSVSGKRGEV